MRFIYSFLVLFVSAYNLFGQIETDDLKIISTEKGIKTNYPSYELYHFMESRENNCYRLFWFKDEIPTPFRQTSHYYHKRVDMIMVYDEFIAVTLMDYHKGRSSELIIINKNYEVIEEYVFFTKKKKNSYCELKKLIELGRLKTKTDFLKGVEDFQKTIPTQ